MCWSCWNACTGPATCPWAVEMIPRGSIRGIKPNRWRHTCVTLGRISSYFAGFGHLAPSTTFGRLFCMIYALMGIPLSLVVVSHLGRHLYQVSQRWFSHTWLNDRKWLVLLVYMFVGGLFFIWITAVLFSYIEAWEYIDSVYFSFITLSTIGFGDFVPSESCASYRHYKSDIHTYVTRL